MKNFLTVRLRVSLPNYQKIHVICTIRLERHSIEITRMQIKETLINVSSLKHKPFS